MSNYEQIIADYKKAFEQANLRKRLVYFPGGTLSTYALPVRPNSANDRRPKSPMSKATIMSWDKRLIAWLDDPARDARLRKFFQRLGGLSAALILIVPPYMIWTIYFYQDLNLGDILLCSSIAYWMGRDND